MSDSQKITVGVCMIVKNEGEFLERALESVKDADAIYVCDTGSTDGGATLEIASRYTKNVCTEFKWCDSFAAARNHVKSHAKETFILSFDADEFVHDFSKVREAVEEAESKGIKAIDITQISESDGQVNLYPRLFRNDPEVTWHGDAHNYLNVGGTKIGDVKLTYGYSLAHLADPNRTLRILEKAVKKPESGPRELYYLGREYWYRQMYSQCRATLGKYVQVSQFPAEKADAFLMMARCYLAQGSLSDAQDACLQSIKQNPYFKEAVLFMGDLVSPTHKEQWLTMVPTADNRGVLFIRT